MEHAAEKLERDLEIAEEMMVDMRQYLLSDVLFWPMTSASMPRLTLGGYLLRQHRLFLLREQLTAAEQTRVSALMDAYQAIVEEWLVHVEQKAHAELHARIRQWTEYMRDLREDAQARVPAYYATSVETRAIIAALLDQLRTPPFRIEPHIPEEVELLDTRLRSMWHSGDFLWPEAWQPAYPPETYWWLYGAPL